MLLFYCSFIFSVSLFAQNTDWALKIYNTEEGLSHREVKDMARDGQNFLWIATRAGLDRFDGYSFLNFKRSDEKTKYGYSGGIIKKIFKVEKKLFVLEFEGTRDSVGIFNPETFEYSILHLINERSGISDIIQSPDGEVLILRTEENRFEVLKITTEAALKSVFKKEIEFRKVQDLSDSKLLKLSSGDFEIATSNSLIKISKSGIKTETFLSEIIPDNGPKNHFQPLLFFENSKQDQYITFRNPKGVFIKKKGSDKFVHSKDFDINFSYNDSSTDDKGNFLVGAENDLYTRKLYRLSNIGIVGEANEIIDAQPKIQNYYGENFYKDLFVCTHVGLYHFHKKSKKGIRKFLHNPNLTTDFGKIMRGIKSHPNGKTYIVEEQQNWYELDKEKWKIKTLTPLNNDGVPFDTINGGATLIIDDDENIWGVSYGLNRNGRIHKFNPNSDKWTSWKLNRPSHQIRLLIRDEENKFWILGINQNNKDGFIFRFNPDTGSIIPFSKEGKEVNPLKDYDPQFAELLPTGELGIGSTNGFIILDLKNGTHREIEQFKKNKNSRGAYIPVFAQTNKGQIWVGTLGNGIYILDSNFKTTERLTLENGLPSNEIYGLLQTNDSTWLISTGSGLSQFNSQKKVFRNYFRDDGLPNDEFNRLSFHKDQTGTIYFGGINGLSIFENEQFFNQDTLPQIRISRFFKYSSSERKEQDIFDFDSEKQLDISPSIQYFGFEFMLPQFWESEKNLFRTWLEGFEEEPRAATTQNSIRYDKLPAGKYVLHIGSADWNGDRSTELLSIDILVKQVFYKTGWFLAALFLFGLVAIYFFYRFQIRRLKAKQKEESIIKTKMANLELQALRSQLNPHFIFNCMGSIEFFIRENQPEIAGKYLTKFGRLMRLFLESSRNRYISLTQELEMLHLYIDLEKIRFNKQFTKEIIVDELIDPEEIYIPSILLQPFVENAIQHGLFHKKEPGKLTLRFLMKEDFIVCEIEDNGVGRKKAAEFKKKSISNHISRGMGIIEERMEVIKKTDDFDIKYKISDLTDQTGLGIGTIVKLKIPIID